MAQSPITPDDRDAESIDTDDSDVIETDLVEVESEEIDDSPVTRDDSEDAVTRPDSDDDADADEADDDAASDAATAKRVARGREEKLSKEELRLLAKQEEKERIQRSKEIAAVALGKKAPKSSAKPAKSRASSTSAKGATAGKGSRTSTSERPLTKEQLRAQGRDAQLERGDTANPAWFKPVMFGFLILGFLWVIVYYISQGKLPLAELRDWNILIGFGIAMIGFLMMTNWK